MKKIILIATVLISTLAAFSQSNAYWYNHNKAKLTQYPITEDESYMFPTYDAQTVNYDDTMSIDVTQYETALDIDSISATSWVILTPTSDVLAGAKLHLHCETTGGLQTVYVKQGSSVVDTLTVGDYNTNALYYYDGSVFVKQQSTAFPGYKGAITQASSITTGVTVNADAGVVTTVSSTLAIDSGATFTVTNSTVSATSVILLSIEYAGNGTPVPVVNSQTAGSFDLKIKNLGNATLNAVIKVHFLILNR